MKSKTLLLIALLIAGIGLLTAASLDDSYHKMLAAYGKLTSWQAFINQENIFLESDATLKSTGNFYYQKGKVAIRYNKPNEQYLLVKDGKVTVYDKTAQTAVRSRLSSSVQSLNPVEIVKTYWQRSQKTLLSSEPGTTAISLKPRSDNQIREIRVTLLNSNGYVKKLTYTDKSGNVVSLTFTKIKVNQAIPNSVWQMPIPKTIKIMEF